MLTNGSMHKAAEEAAAHKKGQLAKGSMQKTEVDGAIALHRQEADLALACCALGP